MPMNPRLLRPTTSGRFDPRRLAGLGLWLDAADTSTITLDGSSNVQEWRDKSGNSRHAGQTTSANRPDYASTLNGRKVVTFAGFPESMTGTNPTQGATLRTVFAVFSAGQGGSNANEAVLDLGNTTATGQAFAVTKEIAVRMFGRFRNFDNPVSAASIVTISATAAEASNVTARKNGQNLSQISVGVGSFSSGSTYALGAAQSNNSTYFLFGSVAEIVVYSRALSSSEVDSVERYLSSKWGIALA